MFPDNNGKDKKSTIVVDSNDKNNKTVNKSIDISDDIAPQIDLNNLKNVSGDSPNKDLLAIKQKALQQIIPLISILEQPPEQLFRTIMMIIQETDNADLLEKAYDTAVKIQDEKGRAEALLAIANEINYFTSK